ETIKNEITALESEYEQLMEAKDQLDSYLEELEKQTTANYEESKALSQKKTDGLKQLEELKHAKTESERQIENIKTNLLTNNEAMESTSAEKQKLETQYDELKNCIHETEMQEKLICQDFTQKNNQLEELNQKISHNEDASGKFASQIDLLSSQVIQLQSQIASSENELTASKNKDKELTDKINDTEVKIKSLKLKKEGLSLLKQSETLGHSKNQRFSTLNEIISPKPGFERIVKSFLKEYGDYCIAGSIDETFALLCESGLNGYKLILAPISRISDNSVQSLDQAVEITTNNDSIRDSITNYLSKFVIVNSLSNAKQIYKSNGNYNFITSKGEMIVSDAYKSETYDEEELQQLLSALEDEKNQYNEEKKTCEAEINELESSIKTQQTQLNNSIKEKELNNGRLNDLRVALNDSYSQKELISADLNNSKGQLDEATQKRIAIQTQFDSINNEILSLEQKIQTFKNEHTNLASQLELNKENLIKIENNILSTSKEIEHIQIELDKIGEILRERETHNTRITSELDQSLEKIEKNEENKILKMQMVETVSKDLEKIKVELDSFTKYIASIDEEIALIHTNIDSTKNTLSECNKSFHDCELEYKVLETKIEEHKRRVFEDLNEDIEKLKAETAISENINPDTLKKEVDDLNSKLRHFGAVNMIALEKLEESEQRLLFLEQQKKDLIESRQKLIDFINELNKESIKIFKSTIELVETNFSEIFRKIFGGGMAGISIVKEEGADPLEEGVEIMARLPGKKTTKLSLMSGGEKALTTIALTLALFKVKHCGVCVLDEVDAPLDEENVVRFGNIIKELASSIQFVIITHNKRSMMITDKLYGITMQPKGITRVIDVDLKTKKLEDIPQLIEA
ncbi:MAG: hypothetical protein HY606_12145, partial [Planctomycetes bacterium]|nr:hypothetical protein [Planctomycetota bacterium]